MSQSENLRLEMTGISKSYPGVQALDNVSLQLHPGEILGLIGENGAGKSTLMGVLGGVVHPDQGVIKINGEPLKVGSVRDSLAKGIAIIYQELNLAPNLDIAQNILLGREDTSVVRTIKNKDLYNRAKQFTDMVGLDIPLTTIIEDLPQSQRQLVEIAKALSLSAQILVLDEPTSSLSDTEAEALFKVMFDLKAKGVSLVYVSHRLHEVQQMCDRVTILRDGMNVGELSKSEINRDNMINGMAGRELTKQIFVPNQLGDVILDVKNMRCQGCKDEFSFSIRSGEVLGIGGLVGSGRTELVTSLFGSPRMTRGTVSVDGKVVHINKPIDAIKAGIMLVPEDRKELGLMLAMSVCENTTLPTLRVKAGPQVSRRMEVELTDHQVKDLQVKTPSIQVAVENLSGGNQQKVVLGKWLCLQPRVLILDEPTRGVDVGAKAELHRLIRELAARGAAVLVVSSEVEEILALCDRVMVLNEGRAQGMLNRDQLTEENLLHLAMGGTL